MKALLFRLDAERAHHLSTRMLELLSGPQSKGLRCLCSSDETFPQLKTRVMGLDFDSPLGLAAGFDKNAELLPYLETLGFSYAELGSVTPRPQGGNPRPRLFRDPAQNALFNRMGFNNIGASLVARNVAQYREKQNGSFVVGVNIGKNKDTPNEKAREDYRKAVEPFCSLVDYVTINVSSPNTPGLRDLQNTKALSEIVDSVQSVLQKWKRVPPLCLKIAPENSAEQLQALAENEKDWGLSSWILCNTKKGMHRQQEGGWSGAPLTQDSRQILETMKKYTKIPVVSVGGIMDAHEAWERLQMGAQLLQVYSGWVYGGPRFPYEIKKYLAERVS